MVFGLVHRAKQKQNKLQNNEISRYSQDMVVSAALSDGLPHDGFWQKCLVGRPWHQLFKRLKVFQEREKANRFYAEA